MSSRTGQFILMSEPIQFGETLVFNEATGCVVTAMPVYKQDDNKAIALKSCGTYKVCITLGEHIVMRDYLGHIIAIPQMDLDDHTHIGRLPGLDCMIHKVALPNIAMHATILMSITSYFSCICIPIHADVTKTTRPIDHQFASKLLSGPQQNIYTADVLELLGLTRVVDVQIATNVIVQHDICNGARSIANAITEVMRVQKEQHLCCSEPIHATMACRNMKAYFETKKAPIDRASTKGVVEVPVMVMATATINKSRTFVFAILNNIVVIIHDGESPLGVVAPASGCPTMIINPAQLVAANNATIAGEITVARRYARRVLGVTPTVNIVLQTGNGNITIYGAMPKVM